MPKGGARPGAGNPGYGKQQAVKEGVERLTPRWFAMIEEMLDAKPDEGMTETVKALAQELIARDSFAGERLIKYLARGATEDRKFALDQLGKLMGKMMPTQLSDPDGNPLKFVIVNKHGTGNSNNRPLTEADGSVGSV